MLAGGCAARGATVHVYGPASRRREPGSRPAGPGAPPGWDFSAVDIADGPRPARDLAAVLRLRRLVARDAPDVLHAHGLRAGALAALALAGPGTPRTALAVTVHNAPPARGPAAAVYAGLELIVARRADAVLTVSGDLDGRMRRRGARLGRAGAGARAAAAASPAEVAALRRELVAGDLVAGDLWPANPWTGGPMAGETGGREREGAAPEAGRSCSGWAAWPPRRDFGTLIGAAARWQRRAPVPLLLIAGEGPLDGGTSPPGRAAGVAVRFLGPRRDVPALLAAADVVVVPSTWEGQPLVVQEALRAGRPLVATRVGGIPELTGE